MEEGPAAEAMRLHGVRGHECSRDARIPDIVIVYRFFPQIGINQSLALSHSLHSHRPHPWNGLYSLMMSVLPCACDQHTILSR